METFKCTECGEILPQDTMVIQDELPYCEACFNSVFDKCENCNEFFKRDLMSSTSDGVTLCQTCWDNLVWQCEHCGEKFYSENERYSYEDYWYCQSCWDENFTICSSCEETIHIDNALSYRDDTYCENCYNDLDTTDDDCNHNPGCRYSERRINITLNHCEELGTIIKTRGFVGVEIECEAGENYDETSINEIIPREMAGIVCDGSLDNGVEVPTSPAEGKQLESWIKKIMKALRKVGMIVSASCGTHIHLNCKGLRTIQLINFLKTYLLLEDFIYETLPPNRRRNGYCKPLKNTIKLKDLNDIKTREDFEIFWYKNFGDLYTNVCSSVIRRHMDLYRIPWSKELFEKLKIEKNQEIIEKMHQQKERIKKNKGFDNRYLAVNMHSAFYRGTIEMRHHGGTLNPAKILHWSEFCLKMLHSNLNDEDRKLISKKKTNTEKFEEFTRISGLGRNTKNFMLERRKKFTEANSEEEYEVQEPYRQPRQRETASAFEWTTLYAEPGGTNINFSNGDSLHLSETECRGIDLHGLNENGIREIYGSRIIPNQLTTAEIQGAINTLTN